MRACRRKTAREEEAVMAPEEESSKASKSVTPTDMAAAIAAAAAGAPASSRGDLGSEASTEQRVADSSASRRRNAEAFESSPDVTAADRRSEAWRPRPRLVTKHAKKDTGGRRFGRFMKAARPL